MRDEEGQWHSIYFDRIVKEKIFHSIDTGKLQEKRRLVEDYKILKGKIGRVPTMIDFLEHGERDPFQYITHYNSYYAFLLGMKESISLTSEHENQLIAFLSKEILNPVRFLEIHLMKTILNRGQISIEEYHQLYLNETSISLESVTLNHALHVINGLFHTISVKKEMVKIGIHRNYAILLIENDVLKIGRTLSDLSEKADIKSYLLDLCEYSFRTMISNGPDFANNDFSLNNRYSRKDVFRILQWEVNPVAQNVGGYMVRKNKADCAIFVNYHKDDDISASTKYHDRFISRNEFIWMSKSKRKLNSPDVHSILSQKEHGMRLPLFVKKNNSEGVEFYYLGNSKVLKETAVEISMPDDSGKSVSVVEMNFILENPVEKSLYDYLVNSD